MAYHSAHDTYFENQVLTASPQKLRWMAIDGAIRFAKQAAEHWRHERIYEGGEALIGCQRLIVELMSAVKPEQAPELAGNVSNLYAYLSRLLNDARRTRDQSKLAEMIGILEIDRETWRLVCEQLGAAPQAKEAAAAAIRDDFAIHEHSQAAPRAAGRLAPPLVARLFEAGPPASGFTASA
jgi:flagellar protein FliS